MLAINALADKYFFRNLILGQRELAPGSPSSLRLKGIYFPKAPLNTLNVTTSGINYFTRLLRLV
jgi:hypothetical protein